MDLRNLILKKMLESIIRNLPRTPGTKEDTGNCSYKMVLLHRQRDTYEVIALPYGTDLRAKVEVPSAVYLKASPTEVKYGIISDPTMFLVRKGNYKYPLIETGGQKKVVPFKTSGDFPEAYTDNRFYFCLAEHLEKMMQGFEEAIGDAERAPGLGLIRSIFKLMRLGNTFQSKSYSLVDELFSEEQNPSSRLGRFERKPKHWVCREFSIPYIPDYETDKVWATGYMIGKIIQGNVRRALVHPFYSTAENRNLGHISQLRNSTNRERFHETLSAVSEMYPGVFKVLKHTNDNESNKSSKRFRNLAVLAGLGTLPFSTPVAIGLISLGIVDRFISKMHARRDGAYTSVIGQVRDLFTPEELRGFYFFDGSGKGRLI